MLHATFQVTGISDLMFGRPVLEAKKDGETHAMKEERLWQRKVPVADDGQCCLNPFCVTNSLVAAAKWLGRKVDGKSGFTGRFQKGTTPGSKVLLYKPDGKKLLSVTIADIDPVLLFVPSDGKRGTGTRVERIFPTLHPEWIARGDVYIWDGKITEQQFRDHLEAVGKFVGWGSMRVENGGINGRFQVDEVTFEKLQG